MEVFDFKIIIMILVYNMKIYVVIVEEKDFVGEKCFKFLIDFKIYV